MKVIAVMPAITQKGTTRIHRTETATDTEAANDRKPTEQAAGEPDARAGPTPCRVQPKQCNGNGEEQEQHGVGTVALHGVRQPSLNRSPEGGDEAGDGAQSRQRQPEPSCAGFSKHPCVRVSPAISGNG